MAPTKVARAREKIREGPGDQVVDAAPRVDSAPTSDPSGNATNPTSAPASKRAGKKKSRKGLKRPGGPPRSGFEVFLAHIKGFLCQPQENIDDFHVAARAEGLFLAKSQAKFLELVYNYTAEDMTKLNKPRGQAYTESWNQKYDANQYMIINILLASCILYEYNLRLQAREQVEHECARQSGRTPKLSKPHSMVKAVAQKAYTKDANTLGNVFRDLKGSEVGWFPEMLDERKQRVSESGREWYSSILPEDERKVLYEAVMAHKLKATRSTTGSSKQSGSRIAMEGRAGMTESKSTPLGAAEGEAGASEKQIEQESVAPLAATGNTETKESKSESEAMLSTSLAAAEGQIGMSGKMRESKSISSVPAKGKTVTKKRKSEDKSISPAAAKAKTPTKRRKIASKSVSLAGVEQEIEPDDRLDAVIQTMMREYREGGVRENPIVQEPAGEVIKTGLRASPFAEASAREEIEAAETLICFRSKPWFKNPFNMDTIRFRDC